MDLSKAFDCQSNSILLKRWENVGTLGVVVMTHTFLFYCENNAARSRFVSLCQFEYQLDL